MKIVIDIGGTNTRIGFSNSREKFEKIERISTPNGIAEFNKTVAVLIQTVSEVESITIGCAGLVDHYENKLIKITNKKGFENLSSSTLLPNINCKKTFFNDTELACLGEIYFGIKNPPKVVAYITISTGVGGAFAIDKNLPAFRYNTEVGHHIIEIGGTEEPGTNVQGTFEVLCGGVNFKNLYGGTPENCEDESVWKKYAEDLAVGLHNIAILWSPDLIVLGGGLSQKSNYFLDPLKIVLKESLKNIRPIPEIQISTLGDKNVLLGGLIK